MASMNFFLLPEWHRIVGQMKQIEFRSIIFSSFVDRDSVELALKLNWYYSYHRNPYPSLNRQDEDRISVVFFPISRKLSINLDIRNRFEKLLQTMDSGDKLENQINNFIENGQNIIEKAHREYELEQRWEEQTMNSYISYSNEDKRNRYIFGPISAKYLKEIIFFPKIIVGEQSYNGIPLNYTVTSFLKKILLPELSAITNCTQLN